MRLPLVVFSVAALCASAGCNSVQRPTTATKLEPDIQKKVQRGIIEPGMTPEMVYLALGKPSEPSSGIVDSTRDGTWVYHDFKRNDRDFIQAGYRRRVVFDPDRRSDVVITEPIDPRLFPNLREHSLHVTFKDGRVSEIKRVERI